MRKFYNVTFSMLLMTAVASVQKFEADKYWVAGADVCAFWDHRLMRNTPISGASEARRSRHLRPFFDAGFTTGQDHFGFFQNRPVIRVHGFGGEGGFHSALSASASAGIRF